MNGMFGRPLGDYQGGEWGSGIGGVFGRGMEFLKTNVPWLWGLIAPVAGWAWNGATSLGGQITSVASSVGDGVQSVSKAVVGAMPSISNATESISHAAEAVSNTATSLTKPISGLVGAISGVMEMIGNGIEKAKWFLIILVGLIGVLIVARVVKMLSIVVLSIGRVIKFITK